MARLRRCGISRSRHGRFGGVLVDHAGDRQPRGSLVAGLAPGPVRAHGRRVECLQVRLSPVVAHVVLGASSELGGTVVALDDLWGGDAARIQERLREAGSWQERFAIAEAVLARRYQAGRARRTAAMPTSPSCWPRFLGGWCGGCGPRLLSGGR